VAKVCKPILEYQETIKSYGLKFEKVLPTKKTIQRFIRIFKKIDDSRIETMIDYPLVEILVISFLAILGGAVRWTEISLFGNENIKWLKKFLPLENGIPSHDTFSRVFSLISSASLEKAIVTLLCENMDNLKKALELDINSKKQICVDGKEQKGTGRNYGTDSEVRNLQTLHIYDASNGICLFSKPIDSKTNEIPVAQEVLKTMNLKDSIVTFDALHTQKETIRIVTSNKGNYIAALKGNQQLCFNEVSELFTEEYKEEIKSKGMNYFSTTEKARGNVETRDFYLSTSTDWFQDKEKWSNLKAFICYEKKCKSAKKETSEVRYYITNLNDIELCADAIRGHWSVENKLHWFLDVVFLEDDNTTMNKYAFNNLSIMKKLALTLYKLTKPLTGKSSISHTKLSYMWNMERNLAILLNALDEDALRKSLNNVLKS